MRSIDRRRFLGFLGAGVAGVALEQAIPFGRVWSFPKEILRFQDPFQLYPIGSVIQIRMPQRYMVGPCSVTHGGVFTPCKPERWIVLPDPS
jgi:hypothetical protein